MRRNPSGGLKERIQDLALSHTLCRSQDKVQKASEIRKESSKAVESITAANHIHTHTTPLSSYTTYHSAHVLLQKLSDRTGGPPVYWHAACAINTERVCAYRG